MSPTTTVSAVSGALVGVATTTIKQASQLKPPYYTPALTTPWIDPTGLGTANLIIDEEERIIKPLKLEMNVLKTNGTYTPFVWMLGAGPSRPAGLTKGTEEERVSPQLSNPKRGPLVHSLQLPPSTDQQQPAKMKVNTGENKTN